MELIPKIFHRIWIGDGAIPDEAIEFENISRKLMPEFEYITWTEESIMAAFEMINLDLYQKEKNRTCRSDIARAEILYRYGGVYVDLDIEFKRDISPLLKLSDGILEFTGSGMQTHSCVMPFVAEHPYIYHAISDFPNYWECHSHAMHTERTWRHFQQTFLQYPEDILILPRGTMCGTAGTNQVLDNAYAVHHTWSGRTDIPHYISGFQDYGG